MRRIEIGMTDDQWEAMRRDVLRTLSHEAGMNIDPNAYGDAELLEMAVGFDVAYVHMDREED